MTTETLNSSTYEALTGTAFYIATAPYAVSAELTLEKVTHASSSAFGGESLSLLFHGPTQPFIPQGVYFLLHDRLPPQALFIVPVGQFAGGFRYEICFNTYHPEPTATAKELHNE